jgi:hypothetical protein
VLHCFRFSPSTADKITYSPTNTCTHNATNTTTDSPAITCAYYATNTATYALGTCHMLSFSCHCPMIVSNHLLSHLLSIIAANKSSYPKTDACTTDTGSANACAFNFDIILSRNNAK